MWWSVWCRVGDERYVFEMVCELQHVRTLVFLVLIHPSSTKQFSWLHHHALTTLHHHSHSFLCYLYSSKSLELHQSELSCNFLIVQISQRQRWRKDSFKVNLHRDVKKNGLSVVVVMMVNLWIWGCHCKHHSCILFRFLW